MKPLEFKEQNCKYAEKQPQYITLPAHKVGDREGKVIFCMGLNFLERIQILFTGRIWCNLMTFGQDLTPTHFTVYKNDYFKDSKEFRPLGLLNYYILQWLYIRVAYQATGETYRYSIIFLIKPRSGWDSDFITINKKMRFIPLTRWKKKNEIQS